MAESEHRLRVLTLNIGSLLEPDWDRRRHEIVAWLDHLSPDVVAFQEVWESSGQSNTAGWIASHAAGDWSWVFGGDSFDPTLFADASLRFGSAVLSRWPIETSTYHRLGVVDDGDAIVAGVPWELVHARTAGIDVFSTHLAPAPSHGHHRQRQVVEIDRLMRNHRGDLDVLGGMGHRRSAMPTVLCGDFNAEPDSDEIRFLSGFTMLDDTTTFHQDAWRLAGDLGPGHTQDWRTNPIAAGLNVHRKRIDYVFVGDPFMRAGDAGRVLDARVVADVALTGILASDHAGVVVDVAWPDRPTAG